jgi:hypothetical protein
MGSVMDRWDELMANGQDLLKEPDVEVLRLVDKEMHRLAAANKRLQEQIERLGHDAQWDHDVVIPDLAARVEEAETKANRLQKHFDGAMAVLQKEQELRRTVMSNKTQSLLEQLRPTVMSNKTQSLLEQLRPTEDVFGEGIDEVTRLRTETEQLRVQRDDYKRAFDAELEGGTALRAKYGARNDETMFDFVERLRRERDEKDAKIERLRRERDEAKAAMDAAFTVDEERFIRVRDDAWQVRDAALAEARAEAARLHANEDDIDAARAESDYLRAEEERLRCELKEARQQCDFERGAAQGALLAYDTSQIEIEQLREERDEALAKAERRRAEDEHLRFLLRLWMDFFEPGCAAACEAPAEETRAALEGSEDA